MKKGWILIMFLASSLFLNSQTLDEEIGFKLVKAEYLLNTERFEDAIRELNDVVKTNPTYKNALLLRAETKYKLAAFKGAKADAMETINLFGITPKAAAILGKSEFALNNVDPALNSITAAIALGEKDVKLFELRAEIYEVKGQRIFACEDWQAAAKMGSQKGAVNARRICGSVDVIQTPAPSSTSTPPTTTTSTQNTNDTNSSETTKVNEPITTSNTNEDTSSVNTAATNNDVAVTTDTVAQIEDPTIPKEDDTIGEVVIDEDLTLQIFGMGLGKRKLMEKPNILILSEKDGVVAIEICVNAEGKVEAAEFIGTKSTISQASLVSLAIRKAKEIWFETSRYTKQCGFVNFVIKGS
jgi:tetratricopeptide (TPR) repeat protein